MSARLTSSYSQTYLTLSAGTCNGTDTVGSLTGASRYVGSLVRKLRIARAKGDLVATILLQQRIRAELAR